MTHRPDDLSDHLDLYGAWEELLEPLRAGAPGALRALTAPGVWRMTVNDDLVIAALPTRMSDARMILLAGVLAGSSTQIVFLYLDQGPEAKRTAEGLLGPLRRATDDPDVLAFIQRLFDRLP